MEKIIITNNLFDSQARKFLHAKAVLIKDNLIAEVFDRNEIGKEHNYEVIDLSDYYVLPGLIDTHVHANINGESHPFEKFYSQSPAFIALNSLPIVQRDLLAGFTTIRDMGSVGLSDIALRDTINSGIHWGPHMFCAGIPLNILGGAGDSTFQPQYSGGRGNQVRFIVNGADECRMAARFNIKYGADHLKIIATSGVVCFTDSAGSQEMTLDEMRAVVEVGRNASKPVAAHAIGLKGIKTAIEAGVSSIEHGTFLDFETAKIMADRGIYLVPTLNALSNLKKHLDDESIPQKTKEKALFCEPGSRNAFACALQAGVQIAFGTDAATHFNCHGQQANEFNLMVNFGMTPLDAIMAATANAAELLNQQDKLGSISKGKYADFVAVTENPLKNIGTLTHIPFIMKDGIVYKCPSSASVQHCK